MTALACGLRSASFLPRICADDADQNCCPRIARMVANEEKLFAYIRVIRGKSFSKPAAEAGRIESKMTNNPHASKYVAAPDTAADASYRG